MDGGQLLAQDKLPRPSCLVVDYHMAGLDGLEVISKLRERNNAIPAILITAPLSPDVRRRAESLGVPIVEKPFMGPKLLTCIQAAFAQS
jgi:two-component system, LuxR family, response regulator FixJ